MKKLLSVMLATTVCSVYATSTTAPTAPAAATPAAHATPAAPAFDSTKMKCGEHTLGTNENVDSLTSMCKGFAFGKGKAGFLDENSGKKVVCQEKKGILLINTCQAAPQQN